MEERPVSVEDLSVRWRLLVHILLEGIIYLQIVYLLKYQQLTTLKDLRRGLEAHLEKLS